MNPSLEGKLEKIQQMDLKLQNEGYPLEAIQTLRQNGIELRDLPVVVYHQPRLYWTDWIHIKELSFHPIVRIEDISKEMTGIAFYVKGEINTQFVFSSLNTPISKLCGVVAFTRYSKKDFWKVSFNGMHTIRYAPKVYDQLGKQYTPSLTNGRAANYQFLNNLLSGKDPAFKVTAPPKPKN
jgi:hypothetical protein